MSQYSYYILDRETEKDARSFQAESGACACSAAEECAEEWHHRLGWDSDWPQIVVLLRDGVEVSRWTVARETHVAFVAEKIEKE